MPATPSDLIAAIAANDVEAIKLAIAEGADPNSADLYGTTPLEACALEGDVEVLRALLDGGMRIEGSTLLFEVHGDHAADKLRLLIERGLDPKARLEDGTTPLIEHLSVHPWQPDAIALLLEQGVDPSATTQRGECALSYVATWGASSERRVAHALIDAGADVNHVEPGMGWSLLMMAVDGECGPRLVEILCEAGADADVGSSWGETPLMRALRDRKFAKAKALLPFTKHLDAADQRGVSVLELAEAFEADVVELMAAIRKGAKPPPSTDDEPLPPIAGP